MRRESLFFGVLTLVASAFLAGCSDDDTEVYVPQRVAEFNLSDESGGNRLFIIHPWEGEIAIPVRDDRIRDFEFSGKYFDWEMRQGAESRFLVLNLKKEVELKPFLEKVALRGIASKSGEAATDTLFLVSQPKLESSVADDAPSYMHNVGKTVNASGDIFAAPKEPFLDFDLIYGTKAFVKTPPIRVVGTGTLRRGLRGAGGQHVAGARHLGERPRLHEPRRSHAYEVETLLRLLQRAVPA